MNDRTTPFHQHLRRDDPVALCRALGWAIRDLALPPSALPAWGWTGDAPQSVRLVAVLDSCRLLECRWGAEERRRLARAVHRHNPHETVLWLWPGELEWTFAFVDTDPRGSRFVRTLTIDRDAPDVMGLEALRRLHASQVAQPDVRDSAERMRRHLGEVLGTEGLTRAFFRGFREAHDRLQQTLQNGPTDARDRHEACLVVLLRVVFLYFVQRAGMLDGDRRYLARRLRDPSRSGLYWEDVLQPLFFGALNSPHPERPDDVARLGEIPFLNGGLFEPTPTEIEHPEMTWRDDVWTEVLEEHFEKYHFTATEPSGLDEARVVDPEMLGKVFEGLMFGAERQSSGAFYTPRGVVRRMVDDVLDAHLEDVLGTSVKEALKDGREADVREALRNVTVLDPAVGTGAFLLEMLQSLRHRMQAVGITVDYAELRRLVHDHLFGVDQQATAVRLCELRIWLVMLAEMTRANKVEPLPNLSHRFAAGDSLLGSATDLFEAGELTVRPEARTRLDAMEERIHALQTEYLGAHGERKQTLRLALSTAERQFQTQWLGARKEQLLARLQPLERMARSDNLFGESMVNERQRSAIDDLTRRIDALDEVIASVRAGRASAGLFSYRAKFGCAARGGFDIVITNPPWVRAQRIDRARRRRLRDRYTTAQSRLWPEAARLGIRTPFGTQPDLAALFLERSLELLAVGGRICALVPAKLFRSLHGAPLRKLLGEHEIRSIEDLSDADDELFDATTYPAIVHVRKGEPSDVPTRVRIVRGERQESFAIRHDELGAYGSPAEPWLLAPNDVRRAFRTIQQHSVPFGTVDGFEPRRGIFTGANDVFIRPRGAFEEELGAAVRPFVRPLLTGSTIDEPTLEILYLYDDVGNVLPDVPDTARSYFAHHRKRLERRSDHRARLPPWQLFRVRADTVGPKLAWRDLSVELEPVRVPSNAVPLNTVYYLACGDEAEVRALESWMAHPCTKAFASSIAERARGGWRRHFAWLVRMLPFPSRLLADGVRREIDPRQDFGLSPEDLDVVDRWLRNAPRPARSAA